MAIDSPPTVPRVGRTKQQIPEAVLAAFRAEFCRWVKERHKNNQSAAGRAIGMSQSQVSALMSGERRPGLETLIKLRKVMGISIDAMLGFEKPPEMPVPVPDPELRREVAQLRADLLAAYEKSRSDPPPPPAPASRETSTTRPPRRR